MTSAFIPNRIRYAIRFGIRNRSDRNPPYPIPYLSMAEVVLYAWIRNHSCAASYARMRATRGAEHP
jgi:hypothetical protein